MAKRRSLTSALHVGEVDDDELATVLTSVLPRGAQFTGNEVEYRTANDEVALTLVYREGRVVEAYAGTAFSSELERQIDSAIRHDLLGMAEQEVCRWTMFAGRRVEGVWRYRDQLQIVPAPSQAARPNVEFADHPFIVDFVFDASPNGQIRNLRYSRKAYELTLVLDLLLVSGISTTSNRGQHRWVFLPWDPTEEPQPEVVWAQDGYFIPDFTYLVASLPDETVQPLAEVESARYYDPYDFDVRSDVLAVPTELEGLLGCFFGLQGENRERFLRACYWHHMARTIWPQSQSLHLASLVNAIECMASIGPERDTPDGPTKLFIDFMREYAPGAPSKKKINRLYDTRSHITHGERLLHYDQPPSAAALTQRSTADRQAGDDATVLCRGALLNWLWTSQEDPRREHIVTRGLRAERPAKPGTKSGVVVVTPGEGS